MTTNQIKGTSLAILLLLTACGGTSKTDKFRKHCKAAAEELVETPSTIKFLGNKFRFEPNKTEVTVEFDAQNIRSNNSSQN